VASIIRIRRSTGAVSPSRLYYGELAYTDGLALTANGGGRLFVGDQNEIPREVGGRYYTDMFLEPGKVAGQQNKTTPANGFVPILDENREVDEWNINGNFNVSGITTFTGTLDINASTFFDWAISGIHTRGVAYFDSAGEIISTLTPEVGYATTSNFVLTTDASNVPVWTSVLDGGSY